MQPIITYLKDHSLPASRSEARKLRRRAAHFVLQEDVLYKRGFASPLLQCVGGEETMYILREIHEKICGNHSGGTALAHKVETEPLAKIIEANTETFVWKNIICRKLNTSKGVWDDEFPHILWAIRTTSRTATGETPFSMTYRAENMSPVKVGVPSHRRIHFNEISNDEAQMSKLHLLEEMSDTSQVNLEKYHRKMTRYYNSKVRNRTLRLGDLVLRRVF
ncbi:uncharacterized protein LOC111391326 [Olea europaea var. sylvestris]|uniref:uncharacterized protein LOC111391326 n=1 Tax=Olea europaea var. sylvestris TaxID=158386 RepID=UPI000C1D82E6|nr:uncharacterized protein LOC111391326 [Olea europaea var. sylvestris]